jgi:hypothetical protein
MEECVAGESGEGYRKFGFMIKFECGCWCEDAWGVWV